MVPHRRASSQRTLKVHIALKSEGLTLVLSLWTDVWLVNRIGLPLFVADARKNLLACGDEELDVRLVVRCRR